MMLKIGQKRWKIRIFDRVTGLFHYVRLVL